LLHKPPVDDEVLSDAAATIGGSSASTDHGAASGTSAGDSTVTSIDSAHSSATDAGSVEGGDAVRLWLVNCGLDAYADAVIDASYDELSIFEDPAAFSDEDIATFLGDIMDEEQRAKDGGRLREAILRLQGRSE
jgi:hypothetical protein